MDGGSTDGTVESIKQNREIIGYWLSEPDDGIYDAWNKAVNRIEGEWVLFLGAGDLLASSHTISDVICILQNLKPDIALAYGNVKLINSEGNILFTHGKNNLDAWDGCRPALPYHQGIFHRRSIFYANCFDQTYKIAADAKFLLQVLQTKRIYYMPVDIACMELMGISTNPAKAFDVIHEFERIMAELNIKVPIFHKIWYKFKCCIKVVLTRYFPFMFPYVANMYRISTGRKKMY